MNQIRRLLQCVAVIIVVDSVTSLGDVHVNDLTIKTVASLLKILKKYENDVKYVIIQENEWKPKVNKGIGKTHHSRYYKGIKGDSFSENKKFYRPGRHILIKRLLPHGLPPSKLEFDAKYQTFYRPLVRVHKRKPLPKIGTILNIDGNSNGIDKYGIDVYDYYDNDENVLKFQINKELSPNLKHFNVKEANESFDVDEELLEPFTVNFPQNYESTDELSAQLIILKEIQKLLRKIRSRFSRNKIYHDISKVLDKITSLRSNQKSGEDNDPMAPGKIVNLEYEEAENGPPKPKKWIPHYAPWNYWTYKKIIYQDTCPEGQVKIANLCIWLPPH